VRQAVLAREAVKTISDAVALEAGRHLAGPQQNGQSRESGKK
jgi:hypothetical protein